MTSSQVRGHYVHMGWGRRAVEAAASRGDVIAVCDVLSFSTAAVIAATRGAHILPCIDAAQAQLASDRSTIQVAVRREAVPERGRFSLSPSTLLSAGPADRIALPSPNGATCCTLGARAPLLLVGCLLNATAAGRVAALAMGRHGAGLTVVACGERWDDDHPEGQLRFALEDYLGAGALLAGLDLPMTADAELCRSGFLTVRDRLPALLRDCPSGRELIERGWPQDVEAAAQLDTCSTVPVLVDGWLQPHVPER